VAFGELFSYGLNGDKKLPVIGYCIVDTPPGFKFSAKEGTKLYKAIANYVDILVINNDQILMAYNLPTSPKTEHFPASIESVIPSASTEEVAVVATYLNQSTINSNWKLCFIHTHHSSWQQVVIDDFQQKINRVSTKLDLIMQYDNQFMLAEAKDRYNSILTDQKIKKAMQDAGKLIDAMYSKPAKKFNAFLYNLPTSPTKDPDYYAESEASTVAGGIKLGHFKDIAFDKDFVIIIVYADIKNATRFRLVFSDDFDNKLRDQLIKEFL
jgi:hypothetical protein